MTGATQLRRGAASALAFVSLTLPARRSSSIATAPRPGITVSSEPATGCVGDARIR
jgi:hypothetical protein